MDEYTFILLAKLKADRLRLEREEQAGRQRELFADQEKRLNRPYAPWTAWFSRDHEWREQS
jgi:hypothetical protein